MTPPTAIDIKNIGIKLDDLLMALTEDDLDCLGVLATSEHSDAWSCRLADWARMAVDDERKRRRLEVVEMSPPWLTLMTDSQLAGCLALATLWRRASVSAAIEAWTECLFDMVLGVTVSRLLDKGDN